MEASVEEIKEPSVQEENVQETIVEEPSVQEEKKPKKKKGKFIVFGILGLVCLTGLSLGSHRLYKASANEEVINYMKASYDYDVYYNPYKDTVDIVDYIGERDLVGKWETEGGLSDWRAKVIVRQEWLAVNQLDLSLKGLKSDCRFIVANDITRFQKINKKEAYLIIDKDGVEFNAADNFDK